LSEGVEVPRNVRFSLSVLVYVLEDGSYHLLSEVGGQTMEGKGPSWSDAYTDLVENIWARRKGK
jgi:hypothetical protein